MLPLLVVRQCSILCNFQENYWTKLENLKKAHICKEGGPHLRITVWHSFMDLKNNYLLKKLLKGWILIFTMLYLKKRKKNTWRYYYFILRTKNPDDMIYSSWDNRVWQTEIGNYGSFFTLLPPPLLKTQQIRNLKKWRKKKIAGDIIILHMCTKNTIIWGTVREIQSETDRIFCHLWSFFTPYNPQNQNFEKMKKVIAYVIILHMCTINHDHMIYASWDIRPDRIFCHFGPFFALWPS